MTMTPAAEYANHGCCCSCPAAGEASSENADCCCAVQASLNRLDESISNLGHVRRCSSDAVVVGKILGSGKFSDVYEASFSTLEDCPIDEECIDLRRRHENEQGQKTECVLKHLKNSLASDDVELFRVGANDLASEVGILSSLEPHANVVRFHGVVGLDLLLEKLTSTLAGRLPSWKADERPYRRGKLPLTSPQTCRSKLREQLRGRLRTALDVVKGLRHLHSQGIMHRDLKPENIGISAEGTAKIFDFGLAKRFFPTDNDDEGNGRKTTGLVGTFRYMAPEVAKCQNYDERIDLYSFGLILFGICAIDTPYGSISRKDFQDKVVYGDKRPDVSSAWPSSLGCLMSSCWSDDPDERPSCEAAVAVLEYETSETDDEMASASSSRRRSRRGSSKIFGGRRASLDMLPIEPSFNDVDDSDDDDAASVSSYTSGRSGQSTLSTSHARIPTMGNGGGGGGGGGRALRQASFSRRASLKLSKALSTRF